MASVELATAYVSLVPTMKGAQGAIARELGSVDADGIGRDVGGRMGGGIAGTLKGLVGPALAAAAAVGLGSFVAEAAAASDATDKFKSTMNFAGVDTSGIEKATAAAKSYADQTVYDLPTIQATMAQLASNGVSGYTELTEAAGNLNAVAGGNAETFKSVSRTLTQSAGAGKLMTEDWNMLADAIPGAAGPLKSALEDAGAYTGNFKDAMAAGEITSEEFQASLMKLGMDPIAVEASRSVTTFEGAIGGLEATINSGLMTALDAMKPAITGAINGVSTGIGAAFGWIGTAVTGLRDIIVNGDYTGALREAFGLEEDSPVIDWMLRTREAVQMAILDIKDIFAGFTMPEDMVTQYAGQFSNMEAIGIRAKEIIQGVFLDISDFIAGFTMPDDMVTKYAGQFSNFESIGITVRGVFNDIWAAVAPLIPSMLALWQSVSPVSTIFAALGPSIGPLVGVIGTLAASVGGSLVQAITGILPAIQTLQGVFISLFTDVLATVLPVIVQLVGMFGTTLASLVPILVPIVVQIATLAATLVSQLAPIFMQLVSTVLPMVVSAIGAILPVIGPLISTIAGLLIPVIQALMPVVVTVFGVIANVITNAMQIVQGIIQVVTGIISGNWAQVWSGILNVVSGVFGLIVSLISGAIQGIVSIVGAGLSIVISTFTSIFSGVVSYVSTSFRSIVDGAAGMLNDLVSFFGQIGGKIIGAIGNVGGSLFSVGVNIIQGLINGIGSMMGAIGRAVLNIVPEAIRGPFEDLLGIHSPSRVFQGYGVNIGQGLINGLDGMHGKIASSVEGMVTVPTAQSFGAGSFSTATPADAFGGGGGRLALMVNGREFEGYLVDTASSVVQSADSQSPFMRRGR